MPGQFQLAGGGQMQRAAAHTQSTGLDISSATSPEFPNVCAPASQLSPSSPRGPPGPHLSLDARARQGSQLQPSQGADHCSSPRAHAARPAEDWNRSWDTDVRFRTTMRVVTAAFGSAFLIDAAARVIMADTVPLDLVPILSVLLLLFMLASIVVAGRIYATGHLAETPQPLPE